jgi:hypothetical protein
MRKDKHGIKITSKTESQKWSCGSVYWNNIQKIQISATTKESRQDGKFSD